MRRLRHAVGHCMEVRLLFWCLTQCIIRCIHKTHHPKNKSHKTCSIMDNLIHMLLLTSRIDLLMLMSILTTAFYGNKLTEWRSYFSVITVRAWSTTKYAAATRYAHISMRNWVGSYCPWLLCLCCIQMQIDHSEYLMKAANAQWHGMHVKMRMHCFVWGRWLLASHQAL